MEYSLEVLSIIGAVVAVSLGAIVPAYSEGRAIAAAMDATPRQPEPAGPLARTRFVGLAMTETKATYCLVIALLLPYAHPCIG